MTEGLAACISLSIIALMLVGIFSGHNGSKEEIDALDTAKFFAKIIYVSGLIGLIIHFYVTLS